MPTAVTTASAVRPIAAVRRGRSQVDLLVRDGRAAWRFGGRRRMAGASGSLSLAGGARSRGRSLEGRLRRWLRPIADAVGVSGKRFARRWAASGGGRDEERDRLVGGELRAGGRDLGEDLARSRAGGYFELVADGKQPMRANLRGGNSAFGSDELRRRDARPEGGRGRWGFAHTR